MQSTRRAFMPCTWHFGAIALVICVAFSPRADAHAGHDAESETSEGSSASGFTLGLTFGSSFSRVVKGLARGKKQGPPGVPTGPKPESTFSTYAGLHLQAPLSDHTSSFASLSYLFPGLSDLEVGLENESETELGFDVLESLAIALPTSQASRSASRLFAVNGRVGPSWQRGNMSLELAGTGSVNIYSRVDSVEQLPPGRSTGPGRLNHPGHDVGVPGGPQVPGDRELYRYGTSLSASTKARDNLYLGSSVALAFLKRQLSSSGWVLELTMLQATYYP